MGKSENSMSGAGARRSWAALALAAVAAVALGFVGFSQQALAQNAGLSPLDRLYLALQLFTMESGTSLVTADSGARTPLALDVARYLAPGVAVWAAIQAGLVLFGERLRLWRLRGITGHVVVCGLGRKGLAISQAFARQGRRVIAIERDPFNQNLEPARRSGIICLLGSAEDREAFERSRAFRAELVFIVCGDDALNAEIAVRAAANPKRVGARFPATSIFTHVDDPELCMHLRNHAFASSHGSARGTEFFSVTELAARALFDQYAPIADTHGGRLRVLIAGLDGVGSQVAALAAREAWLAARAQPETRFELRLVGPSASRVAASLTRRLGASRACAVTALDVESAHANWAVAGAVSDESGNALPDIVFVHEHDDSLTLRTALRIREWLRAAGSSAPVAAALDEGLGGFGHWVNPELPDDLRIFSILASGCQTGELRVGMTGRIARSLHEIYRRETAKTSTPKQMAENPAMKDWDALAEDFRQSNRHQAENIARSLEAVGARIVPATVWEWPDFQFAPGDLEKLARGEHDRWMQDRAAQGWRHGEKKDPQLKTHPDLVPWEVLSEPVREKDRWFVREWPVTLARAGFAVRR